MGSSVDLPEFQSICRPPWADEYVAGFLDHPGPPPIDGAPTVMRHLIDEQARGTRSRIADVICPDHGHLLVGDLLEDATGVVFFAYERPPRRTETLESPILLFDGSIVIEKIDHLYRGWGRTRPHGATVCAEPDGRIWVRQSEDRWLLKADGATVTLPHGPRGPRGEPDLAAGFSRYVSFFGTDIARLDRDMWNYREPPGPSEQFRWTCRSRTRLHPIGVCVADLHAAVTRFRRTGKLERVVVDACDVLTDEPRDGRTEAAR